jgi:hypothetical protein
MRSLAELETEDDRLFKLFHSMPNNEERAKLYGKWLLVRDKINILIYAP